MAPQSATRRTPQRRCHFLATTIEISHLLVVSSSSSFIFSFQIDLATETVPHHALSSAPPLPRPAPTRIVRCDPAPFTGSRSSSSAVTCVAVRNDLGHRKRARSRSSVPPTSESEGKRRGSSDRRPRTMHGAAVGLSGTAHLASQSDRANVALPRSRPRQRTAVVADAFARRYEISEESKRGGGGWQGGARTFVKFK